MNNGDIALGIRVGEEILCCYCAELTARESGDEQLFFTVLPKEALAMADFDAACPRCSHPYGGRRALDSAIRISEIIVAGKGGGGDE